MSTRRPSLGVTLFVLAFLMLVVLLPACIIVVARSFDGSEGLKYEFARNDAALLFPVDFDLKDVPERLDASGYFHTGYVPSETDANVYDINLDGGCGMARVMFNSGLYTTMRVLGVDPSGDCPEDTTSESLMESVAFQLVPRLNGTVAAKPSPASGPANFFRYPPERQPTLRVEGSLENFVRKLDKTLYGAHEFHEGQYTLDVDLCSARFHVVEDPTPEYLTIFGVGYTTPCFDGADEGCLRDWFELVVRIGGLEVVPTPAQTALPEPTACGLPFD